MGSDVSTLAVGSKVIGINKEKLGGFAEECVTSEQVQLYTTKYVFFVALTILKNDSNGLSSLCWNRQLQLLNCIIEKKSLTLIKSFKLTFDPETSLQCVLVGIFLESSPLTIGEIEFNIN